MSTLATTKMSSRGQVVIPEAVRNEMGLKAGSQFVVTSRGDAVMLNYMAANYDETVFTDPLTFDITRSPNPHVAFGGGGPHHCLGVSLARLEMRILFEELLRQVDRFEQVAPADRLRSNFINGIKHLQVHAVKMA